MDSDGRIIRLIVSVGVIGLSIGCLFGCRPADQTVPTSDEIRIGYFGPGDPAHPVAGDMWLAACMALEKANRVGGFNGRSFRLIPCWADDPWSGGVNAVTRAVFVDRVCAFIGGIDGPTTHLAEQVVVKAQLAMINPSSTDKTINLAFVPWVFSCLPDDEAQSRVLAETIDHSLGPDGCFVVLSADDHDSHLFAVELLKALNDRNRNPRHHVQFDSRQSDPEPIVQKVLGSSGDGVVLIAPSPVCARFLRALRNAGISAPIFGGPWMGQNACLESAGPAAEGVIFPWLWIPSPSADDYVKKFRKRTGKTPDYRTAQTYDAILVLTEAIRKSGPDRLAIIEALKEMSPRQGVTGIIHWDRLGRNQRPVLLGTIRNGRIQPISK